MGEGQDKPGSYEYDLFLSHRSVDDKWAGRLAARIEREEFRGRPLGVWIDEADARPGLSATRLVNDGLERSRFIGLVLTPDYFESASGWTDAEWQAALFTDPAGRQGRVIPLLAKDCPYIPILLRHIGMIDFRDPRQFESSVAKLVRILREEPLPRPKMSYGQVIDPDGRLSRETIVAERAILESRPDAVEEVLLCNLLPVTMPPDWVWSAPIARRLSRETLGRAAFPTKAELRVILSTSQRVEGAARPFKPAFIRHEDRLLTFHNLELEDSPLAAVIERAGSVRESTRDWVVNPDERRLLMQLLNMTVDRHCYRLGMVKDADKGRFFFPPTNGKDQRIRWRAGARPRTVTKRYVRDDGRTRFWRHVAAALPIMCLASRFYMQVLPRWLFTRDGTEQTLLKGPTVGPLAMRWTGKERNLHILYHVRFWAYVLGRGRGVIQMRAGDQELRIEARPASIRIPLGIANDRANLDALLHHVREDDQEIDWEAPEEDVWTDAEAEPDEEALEDE